MINQFNIRVYGLLIDERKLLVTDEYRLGIQMTKFPGGELNFGEGTIDCLKREFIEELNLKIDIIKHYYTTDYFQPTKLLPETHQLIAIYYLVKAYDTFTIKTTDKQFDFPELIEGTQTFRWLSIADFNTDNFTLPIDKKVAQMIINEGMK